MRRALLITVAALALLLLLAGVGSGASSKTRTALPISVFEVASSDLYCAVTADEKPAAVACFHGKLTASGFKRTSYAIIASEHLVGVEPTASTHPVWLRTVPSMKGVAIFSGGARYPLPVHLFLNDVVAVGKTHMVLLVTKANAGGLAIGVIYVDGNNNPLPSSYAIGISSHYVTVAHFDAKGHPIRKPLYRHAVR